MKPHASVMKVPFASKSPVRIPVPGYMILCRQTNVGYQQALNLTVPTGEKK